MAHAARRAAGRQDVTVKGPHETCIGVLGHCYISEDTVDDLGQAVGLGHNKRDQRRGTLTPTGRLGRRGKDSESLTLETIIANFVLLPDFNRCRAMIRLHDRRRPRGRRRRKGTRAASLEIRALRDGTGFRCIFRTCGRLAAAPVRFPPDVFRQLLGRAQPRRRASLPARATLYARPRPRLARKARQEPGLTLSIISELERKRAGPE
jgi:hypothetical protein